MILGIIFNLRRLDSLRDGLVLADCILHGTLVLCDTSKLNSMMQQFLLWVLVLLDIDCLILLLSWNLC